MARLFISAERLERWTVVGKVKVEADVMLLPALRRSFRLQPAVRVHASIDGGDALGLIGRVKTDQQLAALGAEHLRESLIIGEAGYECEEGFVGTPLDGGPSELFSIST